MDQDYGHNYTLEWTKTGNWKSISYVLLNENI
jgi:hypothetical protein